MEQKILELYETPLGRIKFFQKFIRLLHLMHKEFNKTEELLEEVKKELASAQKRLNKLEKDVENIPVPVSTVEDGEEIVRDFTRNTSANIMDRHYAAYQDKTK